MKQYKVIRIDMETYKNFVDKQNKISKVYQRITGKNKRIPFTKILKISSKLPVVYLGENNLLKSGGIKI